MEEGRALLLVSKSRATEVSRSPLPRRNLVTEVVEGPAPLQVYKQRASEVEARGQLRRNRGGGGPIPSLCQIREGRRGRGIEIEANGGGGIRPPSWHRIRGERV